MRGSSTTDPGGGAGRLSGPLRAIFGVGTLSGLTDGQLLERYQRGRGGAGGAAAEAEAAFAALVERHGPMVLSACRAILGDRHDAEDACQAAFLVLSRRAGAIRRGDAVASWLYGVARRISARARRDLARRRELERRRLARAVPAEPASGPPADPWPELYEELDRLAEPFRAAVVLCDLEGRSYEQAAGLLGCPVGTIQSRLSRGRERLRRRLERRGIAPAVVGIGAGGNVPTAALPPRLSTAIVRAAVGIARSAPSAVAVLAGAEIRRQVMIRLTMSTMLLAAGVMVTAAIGLSAIGRGDDPAPARPPAAAKVPDPAPIHVRVVDLEGKGASGIAVEVRAWDHPVRSFTTDADGRAAIPSDAIGPEGVLIARRGGDAMAWCPPAYSRPPQPAGAFDDPIAMALLPLDHRAEGSVADGEGRPIPGATIRAISLQHPINGSIHIDEGVLDELLDPAVTDEAGRFTIRVPRQATALLRAFHPRYAGPWIVAQPDEGALEPATLEPAGGIVGRVVDATTGRPVAGALVDARLVERRPRVVAGEGRAVTDDRGRFAIIGLEPGPYDLVLRRVAGREKATAPAVEDLRVRAGADATADLAVIDGRPLRGIAIDLETRRPLPGRLVVCHGPAWPRSCPGISGGCRADGRGRFLFHVPPGEQTVGLADGGGNGSLDHRTVVVPEHGEADLIRLLGTAGRDEVPGIPPPRLAEAEVAGFARAKDEPIPPGLRDRLSFVGLDARGTERLDDGPGPMGDDLFRLPRGLRKLGATYFRIGDKMIHVRGERAPGRPPSVEGIPVRARGRVLHFLHATRDSAGPGTAIGAYVIHYADGTVERIPVLYESGLSTWWFRRPTKDPAGAKVAWTGLNDASEFNRGLKIRLFDMAWTNPHPEREVAALDVLSAGKGCDPFLVAVTVQK